MARIDISGLVGATRDDASRHTPDTHEQWMAKHLKAAGLKPDVAARYAADMRQCDPRYGAYLYAVACGWKPTGPNARRCLDAAVAIANGEPSEDDPFAGFGIDTNPYTD